MQRLCRPRPTRRSLVVIALGVAAAAAATAGAMALLTYSNPAPITINDAMLPPTPATPYPSNIAVPATTGNVSNLTVTISGVSHTFPDDIDMLLVSPNASKMEIWSDACGSAPIPGQAPITVTLSDVAALALPDAGPCITTSYKPGDYSAAQDPFAAPAPAGPYAEPTTNGAATLNSTFAGAGSNPTGTWSLYVVDDLSGDAGSISGGWALNFTGPTGVQIASFLATQVRTGVKLTWRSGSEASLAGFNLYRSDAGKSVRLNSRLIRATASGTIHGASYSFLDRTVGRGAHSTYRLETVGLDGTRSSRVFATVGL
jgi:subtilisin-like proprotein convertase family protein